MPRSDTPSKLQTVAARPELANPLIRAARWYLADGHTVEECLSLIVIAAQQEWPDTRIVFLRSAQFLIDGGASFEWPEVSAASPTSRALEHTNGHG